MRRRSRSLLLCLLLALAGCRAERAAGPIRQEAYVWQRRWTPAVRDSVRQARAFEGLVVLAADVPPTKLGDELTLIEASSARGWVEEAARFDRPFRAALPTYGYAAAFDARGKLLGLLAEGPLVLWSEGVTVRTGHSDPVAMAGLIRGWRRDRPATLAGVLWYRLPVAGDRYNWSWPTLQAVTAGRAPRGKAAEER